MFAMVSQTGAMISQGPGAARCPFLKHEDFSHSMPIDKVGYYVTARASQKKHKKQLITSNSDKLNVIQTQNITT